jgi:hypothetical protein
MIPTIQKITASTPESGAYRSSAQVSLRVSAIVAINPAPFVWSPDSDHVAPLLARQRRRRAKLGA